MKLRHRIHHYSLDRLDTTLHILSRMLGLFLIIFSVMTIYLETHAEDLLEKAFYPAKTYETVIDLGSTKNAVGNQIFKENVVVQAKTDGSPVVSTQAPLLIQITKWLLRITIVLSITMVLYNGIMYIVESAKGGDVKNATKNIGMIVGGILLALLSLGIINLLRSVTG